MATSEGNTVIHRKARVAREEYQARAMSPAKALRLALAQAADRLFDLALVVTAVEQVEISQTALWAEFAEGGLMVLLDGPAGARGAVRMDPSLLAALIEVQTTGRVTGRAFGTRAVTRTDAAIAAPLIDAALDGAGAQLGDEAPDHWAAGFRFGVMMEDARGMALALDAPAFHVFRLMVEVADGAFPGAVTFLLPVPAPGSAPVADGSGAAGRTLEHSAMAVPVGLDAVLSRITLPLDRVGRLAVGDCLPVPTDPPLQVRLEVSRKHVIAVARLGQMNGARAVRLDGGSADAEKATPTAHEAPGPRATGAVTIDDAAATPMLGAMPHGADAPTGNEDPARQQPERAADSQGRNLADHGAGEAVGPG